MTEDFFGVKSVILGSVGIILAALQYVWGITQKNQLLNFCLLLVAYTIVLLVIFAWNLGHAPKALKDEEDRKRLAESRKQLVKERLTTLTPPEIEMLRRILIAGQMTREQADSHLGVYAGKDALERIVQKTNFIQRTYVGHYEVNPALRDVLEDLHRIGSL